VSFQYQNGHLASLQDDGRRQNKSNKVFTIAAFTGRMEECDRETGRKLIHPFIFFFSLSRRNSSDEKFMGPEDTTTMNDSLQDAKFSQKEAVKNIYTLVGP
jgi:hypothetical protein